MPQKKKIRRVPFLHRVFYPKAQRGRMSYLYLVNLAIIIVIGLVVLFSASYATAYYRHKGDSLYFIRPQFGYALLGIGVMMLVGLMDYHFIRKFTWLFYLFCLGMLVLVLFMPPINGCKRWINVSGLPTLQVSEMAKFSLVLCVAHLMERHKSKLSGPNTIKVQARAFVYGIVVPGIVVVPFWALLYFEPHNSAMILMGCILATMLLMGGTELRWFLLGGGGIAGAGALFILGRAGYVQDRLAMWKDPFLDPKGKGHQTIQSLYAVASGGIKGLGIGNSRQKYLWLPEANDDFIFAVLCEELGFIGAGIVILLFAALILQGIYIALRAPDRFGMLLCVGVTAQVAWQVVFNIAVVTNTVPNTGISLPFFSSGGTSLVMLLTEMGVIISVSRAGNQMEAEREKAAREAHQKETERERYRSYLDGKYQYGEDL